jgi:hypothetical protein
VLHEHPLEESERSEGCRLLEQRLEQARRIRAPRLVEQDEPIGERAHGNAEEGQRAAGFELDQNDELCGRRDLEQRARAGSDHAQIAPALAENAQEQTRGPVGKSLDRHRRGRCDHSDVVHQPREGRIGREDLNPRIHGLEFGLGDVFFQEARYRIGNVRSFQVCRELVC